MLNSHGVVIRKVELIPHSFSSRCFGTPSLPAGRQGFRFQRKKPFRTDSTSLSYNLDFLTVPGFSIDIVRHLCHNDRYYGYPLKNLD